MQIRNVYGIDLGTSTVKIYDLKKDTITKEKNMIAIRNREQVIAVGNYAYEMHERTPSNIEVITPMSNGRIANVLMVEAVLHTLLHRCTRHMGYRPELYFSVPCDMTEIEHRDFCYRQREGYFFQNHPGRRKTVQRIDMQSEPTQKQFPDWLQNSQTCQDCAGGSWNRQKRGAEGARRRWCIRNPNIDRYLSRQLGCPVQLSQYYDLCTICGLKELITHDALHRWAYTVNKKK